MSPTTGLLLVGHGSADPAAAPVAHEVAAAVVRRLPGLVGQAVFLDHAEPTPATGIERLAAAGAERLVVQPFLLSHAYHSRIDLPAVAGLARERGLPARVGGVLGPDPLLLAALRRRLAEAGTGWDAVVLAAAGSSDAAANAQVAALAADLGALLGVPARVGYASATAPTVGEAVADAAASSGVPGAAVAVATYLLAPGFFAGRVAATARAAGAAAVSAPLGAAPEVADVVARRVTAALGGGAAAGPGPAGGPSPAA